ncbi:bifunctional 3-demethylubiquinone-9 3-methyltransferase/ 2-octaprenyl-6-hydroxy phenol methylase [Paenibacillus konkukensis]|uniref:Bifunctional 3-demethylubiquinone-9 3-methyltransferase/ 2-octaprenyl-6-hydroxy phenol methylase n=1 Tax=Paenibacillus konkukensis TaxID=2020716 RepID=A0ABY4RPL0_9BACL|nr:methyltransferase domain-containing protein [Paenibacillus konkukensis]UQZ83957.1 bifunctional 3-demethylubiquinone-9 3-methyltransferase/ 2-octaprenyl-6-hydroxy phenol methylase [Paenibacillus konkukensis]
MLPKIEVTEVLRAINKSLNKTEELFDISEWNINLPKFNNVNFLQPKDEYHLSDFLNYHDEDFVRNVYRGLLKRNPEPQGMEYYLGQLRSGTLNKIEILGRIKFSKEARRNNIKVKGLTLPFLFNSFYKIPILGYFLRLIVSVIKLPKIIKNINQYEMFMNCRYTEQTKVLDTLTQEIEQYFIKINNSIANFQVDTSQLNGNRYDIDEITQKMHQIDEMNEELKQLNEIKNYLGDIEGFRTKFIDIESTNEKVSEKYTKLVFENEKLQQDINDFKISTFEEIKEIQSSIERINENYLIINSINKQIKDHKLNIIELQRRLNFFLEETRKRLPAPLDEAQMKTLVDNEAHFSDAMYVSFEDQFRGTREDIKVRLEVYLPYVDKVRERTGDNSVIDIGCGRGEWLELLENNDFKAIGVDMNKVMVDSCVELGLNANLCDAIEYLRSQKKGSTSVITGFHIIEHLPLNKLITLFDEALRVLKPGGMIIFETPNPESIWVGAFTFRGDPTHINPLVPDTVKFLVEQRGYIKPKIVRLHKREEPEYTGQKYVDEIIYKFNMEQDFSIIAYKA